jgi:hypothetical protein
MEKNLLSNNYPILFEVLHTCYLMNDERFKDRIKIYRHSNIEHEYYRHLAKAEQNWFKKIYLNTEAGKLEKFEKIVTNARHIFAVNECDGDYFRKKYKNPEISYIPSFHNNNSIDIKPGKGGFVLYHGNLGVSENYEAAQWLLTHVFPKVKYNVVIAGLNPPSFLAQAVSKHDHIKLVANPPEKEMQELIAEAHVHCLYTAQPTGLKLKLLNVLFKGRFIVCNTNMLKGTGLKQDSGLRITESFADEVNACFERSFSEDLITERKGILERFSNEKNIGTLIRKIFPDN